jgi:phage-related baseplate assembly protein
VAGSRQSYEFWAKTASDLVADVFCDSPEPGKVDLYILLDGGQIPNDEILNLVYETVSDEKVRPLTDLVTVKPPEIMLYDINLKYWISRKNQTSALAIKSAVEKAIEDFKIWQSARLGRDLNPTELNYLVRSAGAKRVEIISPQFTVLPPNAVAICENVNLIYGGLEDD